MEISAAPNDSTAFEVVGKWIWKWLGRLVMVPAVQVLAAVSSWLGIFFACVLLSHHEIDRAMLLGFVVIVLRVFPPYHKSKVLAFDPLFMIISSWGMYITAHRAETDTAVLRYQLAGIISIVVVVGWSLFRDYCRFRYPHTKPPSAEAEAPTGPQAA